MSKKITVTKTTKPLLGETVMVYTKSSTNWTALVQPEIITIEGMKFLEGIQVTGKVGHRLERKRTLIPLDHVASIVEFQSEEDLWSEPQVKHIAPPNQEKAYTPLTSHSQPDEKPHRGERPQRRHHFRNNNNRNQGGGFRNRHGFNRGPRED